MAMTSVKFKTVDEYFSTLPVDVKNTLEELSGTIKKAAPKAEEVISYNMPAYKFNGILVYFMAHKEHIGFYPGNKIVNEVFKDQLKMYKTSKGTIQFCYGKSIPISLVNKIVKYRVKENLEKTKEKGKK